MLRNDGFFQYLTFLTFFVLRLCVALDTSTTYQKYSYSYLEVVFIFSYYQYPAIMKQHNHAWQMSGGAEALVLSYVRFDFTLSVHQSPYPVFTKCCLRSVRIRAEVITL